jgi:glycerophosphoryl diester phosphodiesterase
MIDQRFFLLVTVCILMFDVSCKTSTKKIQTVKLPERGLCAHRGAMETHPENTIPAFRAAVEAGAQMIEFDAWLSKDNQMVVIHDDTVDRTTNGKGKVSDLTLEEIKKLDAGSWKSTEFTGVKVPTLQEVLTEMPYNIWLNVHVKGEGELPVMVARLIAEQDRLHQAFMACNFTAAKQAREAVPKILICNMERQNSVEEYIAGTIREKADFIQLLKANYPDLPSKTEELKKNGVRVNYYKADSPEEVIELFEAGVDFPLVNDIVHMIDVAKKLNIEPVKPLFRIKK